MSLRAEFTAITEALSHQVRVQCLRAVMEGATPFSPSVYARAVDLPVAVVQYHVTVLVEAGLLSPAPPCNVTPGKRYVMAGERAEAAGMVVELLERD